MKYILRNLQTEFIKAQGTLVYWLMVICPLILAGLVFLVYNADHTNIINRMLKLKENPWLKFYQIHYQMLILLFLPLFIAMFNNLIYAKEHQYKIWKHLYALPTPKWSVFVAKSLFSLILLFITFLIFAILLPISGYLLNYIYPKYTFFQYNNLIINHIGLMLRLFVAVMAVWAIHNWLSLRFSNFAISVGVAIMSLVLTPIIFPNRERIGNWIFAYPYTYSLLSINNVSKASEIWNFTDTPILLSVGVALVVLVLGYWEYRRKTINA